jgi:hypothetical protein
MPRDEVDDTDMTPVAFRAAAEAGTPVRVVRSRAEYEAALDPVVAQSAYALNVHIDLAFAGVAVGRDVVTAGLRN